jgi:hypothetical protein
MWLNFDNITIKSNQNQIKKFYLKSVHFITINISSQELFKPTWNHNWTVDKVQSQLQGVYWGLNYPAGMGKLMPWWKVEPHENYCVYKYYIFSLVHFITINISSQELFKPTWNHNWTVLASKFSCINYTYFFPLLFISSSVGRHEDCGTMTAHTGRNE